MSQVDSPRPHSMPTYFTFRDASRFARGWDPLRPEDLGTLWEHLVLEHLQARLPDVPVRYWRDRNGREVDFVLARRRDEVDAVECTWNPEAFEAGGLRAFRRLYPGGRNFLVTPSGVLPYTVDHGGLEVRVCTPSDLPA